MTLISYITLFSPIHTMI